MDGVRELSGMVEQRDLGEFTAPASGMLFRRGRNPSVPASYFW